MGFVYSSCWYIFLCHYLSFFPHTFTEFRSVMEDSSAKQLPVAPTKVAVFKGKRSRPKFTRNIKTGAQMKSSTHLALPPWHESFAAPSLFVVVDPTDNQPVIYRGANKKKIKRELQNGEFIVCAVFSHIKLAKFHLFMCHLPQCCYKYAKQKVTLCYPVKKNMTQNKATWKRINLLLSNMNGKNWSRKEGGNDFLYTM